MARVNQLLIAVVMLLSNAAEALPATTTSIPGLISPAVTPKPHKTRVSCFSYTDVVPYTGISKFSIELLYIWSQVQILKQCFAQKFLQAAHLDHSVCSRKSLSSRFPAMILTVL